MKNALQIQKLNNVELLNYFYTAQNVLLTIYFCTILITNLQNIEVVLPLMILTEDSRYLSPTSVNAYSYNHRQKKTKTLLLENSRPLAHARHIIYYACAVYYKLLYTLYKYAPSCSYLLNWRGYTIYTTVNHPIVHRERVVALIAEVRDPGGRERRKSAESSFAFKKSI